MLEFSVLKDLVMLINKNKIKEITTLKDIHLQQKKVIQLYQGILSGKYTSDAEAAMDIFKKSDDYASYKRLRRKVLDLLINTSFFLDTSLSKYTEQDKGIYNCYKMFAAINILIKYDAKQAGMYLLRHLLEQTIKLEITTLTTEVLRTLKAVYISAQIDPEYIRKVKKQIVEYEQKREMEMKAREIYEHLLEGYVQGRVSSVVIKDEVEEDFKRFLAVADKVNTANFYFVTYNIGNIFYLSRNNIEKSLENSQQALAILKSKKTILKGQLLSFAANELTCYTHLKRFNDDRVKELMLLCDKLANYGQTNWFKVNEIITHQYIYAERYTDALDLHHSSVNHPRFQFLSPANKEIWTIYAGYFHLLARLNAIDENLVIEKVGKLNIDDFEYDFKTLNTVKHGMNIPVIMLPVLFKSIEGEFDEYGRSKESLRKYVDRNLHKKKNIRSTTMIKLLVALDKYPFQPLASKNAIKKLLKIFEDVPIELSEQSSAIEIVPYEKLWALILRYRRVYL
jgi:hypothetical protein